MKDRILNITFCTSLFVFLTSVCCLDSDGIIGIAIQIIVVLSALISLVTVLLMHLQDRRRETDEYCRKLRTKK